MKIPTQTQKQHIGTLGEDIACAYLKKQGYEIIKRNFCVPQGEIDIIARHKDELIFCEVKSRTSARFGYPEESVDMRKMKRIIRAIKKYLLITKTKDTYIRFDIIAIEFKNNDQDYSVHHLKNIELKENVA